MSREFVTYRRADGKLFSGEYAFLMDCPYPNEEGCDIIEETWVLVRSKVIPRSNQWEEYDVDEYYEEEPPRILKFREV